MSFLLAFLGVKSKPLFVGRVDEGGAGAAALVHPHLLGSAVPLVVQRRFVYRSSRILFSG